MDESTLSKIYHIHMSGKAFLSDARLLYDLKTKEDWYTVSNSIFLRRTRIAAWRSCVLEFCKLFIERKTEHFNYQKLLKEILLDETNSSKKLRYSKYQIDMHRDPIKVIIDKLGTLRDRSIAHTDRDFDPSAELRVHFGEMEQLLSFSDRLIKDLYSDYNDGYLLTDLPEPDSARYILDRMFDRTAFDEQMRVKDEIKKNFDSIEE